MSQYLCLVAYWPRRLWGAGPQLVHAKHAMFSIKRYCKTCGTHWSSTTQPKYNKPLDGTKQSYCALKKSNNSYDCSRVSVHSVIYQLTLCSSPHSGGKANTILSTTPCIFQASSGWTQHRLGARLAPHPSEGGEAVLTQLMLYPLLQGEKAAPPTVFSPAFRLAASGQ